MKLETRYWGTFALAFLIVFGTIIFTPYAQDAQDRYECETDRQIIVCEYLIDGVWCQQFRGKIEPVNESAFIIQWMRYDEDTIIRNATLHDPQAREYVIKLRVFYETNTSRTHAVFHVAWYRGKTLTSIQSDEGFLAVRDNTGLRRFIEDIEKVRWGSYNVGDFR